MLLDKLVASQCALYYAGDYDPEELLIADKLKTHYQEYLTLWIYQQEYFHEIKSFQKHIFSKRLNIFSNLKDEKFKTMAGDIIDTCAFGYQDGLISLYKSELLMKN